MTRCRAWWRKGRGHDKKDTKVECLSPREHQVALLVARGFSNKEVARELGISDGTVKLHVQKIFQKLGVRNRYGIWLAAGLDNRRQAETGAANNRVIQQLEGQKFT